MVIDCFTFFNELTVLDIRLNTLYDVVDKFVLIEATRTHTNKEKPLFFQQNKERYAKFLDKIIHVVVDAYPEYSYWSFEHNQRDQLVGVLRQLNLKESDTIFVSDCDEIWNPKILETVEIADNKIYFWPSYITYHYFNVRGDKSVWRQPIILKYKLLEDLCIKQGLTFTGQVMRPVTRQYDMYIRDLKVILDEPFGWHFSYTENIEYKLNSFCHSEHKHITKDYFFNSLLQSKKNPFINMGIEIIDKEECIKTLPDYIKNNLTMFQNYLYA